MSSGSDSVALVTATPTVLASIEVFAFELVAAFTGRFEPLTLAVPAGPTPIVSQVGIPFV
jgi:hypothetical protein